MCYRVLTCNVEILVWLYILIIWKRKKRKKIKISYSLICQKGKIYRYPWDAFLMLWTLLGLGHDTEAVIPLETGFPMLRTSSFTPSGNNGLLEKSLDLIKEWRKNAMVRLAYYQHKLKQGYDADVKLRPLAPRDLVLRKVLGTTKNPAWVKLGPNWEGLYRITSVAGIGAYFLEDLDEHVIQRPWNVNNLKRYYY